MIESINYLYFIIFINLTLPSVNTIVILKLIKNYSKYFNNY